MNTDPFSVTLKIEDKINRFLVKMKKMGMIGEMVNKKLYATDSSPGILYGLAMIHKTGVPIDPFGGRT